MHSPVLRKRVSSTATPTKRPGHQASARSRMGANNCCGSHSDARVQKVLGAPTALFAAVGPDHPRQGAAAQADQRAQGLAHGAAGSAALDKHLFPAGDDLQPGCRAAWVLLCFP